MSVRQGPWTVADVPGQSGRTAVVTGANSGIGLEAAAVLARRGADTILACRDAVKGEAAAARMTAAAPGASVSVVRLGFELQFGTNHLGHFALTGLLLGAMLPVPGSRVVTVAPGPATRAPSGGCGPSPSGSPASPPRSDPPGGH
jgi:NAD(P)-dependent dehydrogenase (short-subunit alcohol dehydrogenase family)